MQSLESYSDTRSWASQDPKPAILGAAPEMFHVVGAVASGPRGAQCYRWEATLWSEEGGAPRGDAPCSAQRRRRSSWTSWPALSRRWAMTQERCWIISTLHLLKWSLGFHLLQAKLQPEKRHRLLASMKGFIWAQFVPVTSKCWAFGPITCIYPVRAGVNGRA